MRPEEAAELLGQAEVWDDGTRSETAQGGKEPKHNENAHKKPANQADIARPFRYGKAGLMVDHIIDNGLSDSSRHSFGQKHDRQ